ncbi:leucine-rich repeat protein [Vallitalea guaymasensis]|uniref:leucine-rich repeat protein n=1 Tax=Vallitalea guaymasensis TaxID=1185412 RepID=UPI00235636C6|nr:leucine-rich repeat protein [Vallitalea guaymasensis]
MKKIILLILMILCFMSINAICYAAETTDGQFNYETAYDSNNNKYVIITNYNGSDTTVNIPAMVDVSFSHDGSMPTPVRKIQYAAFQWEDALTSITIPNTVREIGASVFQGCSSLTSLSIPEGVEIIGGSAFQQCSGITSISIPSTITSLGDNVFERCTSLQSINVDTNNNEYKSIDGVLFTKDGSKLIRYPEGKLDTSYTIPNHATILGDKSFYNCAGLEDIIIHNDVTTIGLSVFCQCIKLTNVVIPKNVTDIGGAAFSQCPKLTKLTILNPNANIRMYLYTGSFRVVVYCYEDSTAKTYVMTDADGSNRPWHPIPEVKNEIPNQTAAVGISFNYEVPTDTFNDTYSYNYEYRATGMPTGITFDESSKTFSGVATATGSYDITITMTEAGNSVSDTFAIIVTPTNTSPTVDKEIPDQQGEVGVEFSYTIPQDTFINVDGYTYTAEGMPSGITFSGSSKTFTGVPTISDLYMVTVTVSDGNNSISDTFNIMINNNSDNIAPTVAHEIPDQTATVGKEFTYIIPENTFTDADDDTLTYSISTTNSAIIFNEDTRTLIYTPTTEDTVSVTITVTDEGEEETSDTFEINVIKPPAFTTLSVTDITKMDAKVIFSVDKDCTYEVTVLMPRPSYEGPYWIISDGKKTGSIAAGDEVTLTVDRTLGELNANLSVGTEYAICVRVADSNNNYVLEHILFTTMKNDNTTTPIALAMQSRSYNRITLTPTNGYEYKMGSNMWQDSNVFTGLNASTEYVFTQRIKETDSTYQSVESDSITISTTARPSTGGGSYSSDSSSSSSKSVSGAKTISSSKKGKDTTFAIKQEDIEVSFNGTAFEGLEKKNVQAKIDKVDKKDLKLSKGLEEQIGDLPIFDISIFVDGKKTNFESDEPIIIEIPINGDYENHKVVAVYIDKKGNAEIMEGIVVNGVMRFTTNHLSNYALMYVDKTFDDVTTHWGKIAVETLASREVINGKSETSFDPNGEITRAEFTALIVRYFNFTSQSKDNYSDIEADKWYTDNISIAKDNNILPEVYGNTFEPSKEITREEMMYILYKSLEVTDRLGNFDDEGDKLEDFRDNNEISSYAIKGAKYLISRDIINGNDNNIINPTGTSTRAEVAQMLYNMIISKKN